MVARIPRLGLRRELLILLPVAALLLVFLSSFVVLGYRNAIDLLVEERREEATRLARHLADQVREAPSPPDAAELRRLAPQARAVTLVDAAGATLSHAGEPPTAGTLAPLGDEPPAAPVGVGPGAPHLHDAVAGFAPARRGERALLVRVDLPAGRLAAERRTLRVLTVLVLGVNGSLGLLLLVFVRAYLRPYETLLERVRGAGGDPPAGDSDEVEHLVETFNRALEGLHRAEEGDDIAALQRTLAPSLESGFLLLDRAGVVLTLNEVGARLLGLGAPVQGRPFEAALAEHSELVAVLERTVRSGRGSQRLECTIRRDGNEVAIGLAVHPLRRDEGEIRAYFVLFTDLTEIQRRAREERLEENLAQLGELAAGVAHELRNSLATLRGYLTLIERRPQEETIDDYLGEMRRESEHLERVLEDFLAFARPGSARLERVDLAALTRRAAADPALDGLPVTIELEGEAPPPVRADPQLLERALRNLLHNAAAAEREARDDPRLVVRLAARGDEVELAVEDRGRGLPEAVRERLFQPFAAGRAGGVGLGLSLARRIVALHGGGLRLEPRPEGGTRAVIRLPSGQSVTEGNDSGRRGAPPAAGVASDKP